MRHLTIALIVGAMTLAVGACGDDGATAEGVAPAPDENPFCESGPALDHALTAEGVPASDVETALDRARADAPAALQDVIEVIGGVVGSDDPAAQHRADYAGARLALADAFVDDCDFHEIDVTAVEYAFADLPATVEPGPTVLRLVDTGAELHMAIVVRLADDYTGALTDLISLPEDEAAEVVTELGIVYVDPGGTSSTVLDLAPGRYALICAVPVGTTADVAAEARAGGGEPEGDPHFTRGMLAEFTVTG